VFSAPQVWTALDLRAAASQPCYVTPC